ncbi:MAG: DUF3667 domain-containing protein [Acidobacteria bacterium]|nr:DUF3667 domain-containing protein [Acidobacteriota bacterium]
MAEPHQAHEACASCGAHGVERYCPNCGEAAVHDGDLALAHLTHDFLHEFTHLDGKIWRTLRSLAIRPGQLTAEYWAGRRGLWIRPLRLFLVASALTMLLSRQTIGPVGFRIWHSEATNNWTLGSAAPRQGALISDEMTHHVASVYLWARYLGLFAFAAVSLLLYRRKQALFGAHVISAMHFFSFAYLLTAITARLPIPLSAPLVANGAFLYMLFMLRRVYGQGWGLTFLKCLALTICVFATDALTIGASLVVALRSSAGH